MSKVKFGLKNAHYAPITEEADGSITYGTPVKLPGSVNLTLNPVGDPVEFFADDGIYYEDQENNGYDGDLEIAQIPDSFRKDVLGDEEINGTFYENANNRGKKFAFLFEFTGDAKARRHVMYYCSAQRPTLSASTKTNTKSVQTSNFTFKSRPRPTDGMVKADSNGTDAATYDNWYKNVHEKPVVPEV